SQGIHQLRVGFHPAFGLEAGQTGNAAGDVLRGKNVLHRQVDDGGGARQVNEGLRLLHVEIDVAGVQLPHAQLEDSHDIEDHFPALAAIQAQLVPRAQAQFLCKLAAHHRVTRSNAEVAFDHRGAQIDDALVAVGVD